MVAKSEKAESASKRVRGKENSIQSGTDSHGSGRTRRSSSQAGHEQISVGGVNRERTDQPDPSRQHHPGKIVDRLILKTIRLIEESESRTADLRVYLAELRDLYAQIQDVKEDSK